jgi:hypothetical protein
MQSSMQRQLYAKEDGHRGARVPGRQLRYLFGATRLQNLATNAGDPPLCQREGSSTNCHQNISCYYNVGSVSVEPVAHLVSIMLSAQNSACYRTPEHVFIDGRGVFENLVRY